MLKNSFITKVYVDKRWLVIFYSLSKSVKCFVKVLRKAGIAVCQTVKWLKYYIIIQTKYYHFSGYEELTLGWDPLYNPVQLQMPFRSPPVSNQTLTSTRCLWEQKQSVWVEFGYSHSIFYPQNFGYQPFQRGVHIT